jgi:hypothetical protein
MSELIRQMLADRDEAEYRARAARLKAIVAPQKRLFEQGLRMMADYLHGRLDKRKAAFFEGCEFALRTSGDPHSEEWSWQESITRMEAMQAAERAS